MLSAFKAEAIHELKSRDKSKVESLLAYGDRLLVGLNTGALRIYRVNENSGSPATGDGVAQQKAVELLREEEKFSKKAIDQLARVKEANLLVSLSDTYVSLHDLQTFQLIERLERSKGTTCFAMTSNVVKENEIPSLVSRLAVAVKRKLLCWTWKDMELLPDVTEIVLEAAVKTVYWINGTRLVAGMDPGFSVIDVDTGHIAPVYKSTPKASTENTEAELAGVRFAAVSSSGMGYMGMGSWVPKPMITGLSESLLLLAKDVNTMFCDADGKPVERRQVPWSLAPEAIAYSYPYLLSLQPPEKGVLQIRNPETLSLLQSISVPGARIMHVPQPNISLAHLGKGFIVASERVIWRMNALSYDDQLADLVKKEKFDEAISFLGILEDTLIDDKYGRIREIKTQKGISLFRQQKYRPALDLFTDAHSSPDRVISLYPISIAGDLSEIPAPEEDNANETENPTESARESSAAEPPSTPSKNVLDMLKGGPKRVDTDAMSIRSASKSSHQRNASQSDRPLEGDDLKLAARCLCSYLASLRVQLQKYLSPDGKIKQDPPELDSETGKPYFANILPASVFEQDVADVKWEAELLSTAQLVDTTLFRAYMLAMPTLAGSLFRIDNFCDPKVVQAALLERERYSELLDFLHGKKLHQQSLELLTNFGKSESDDNVPEGMRGPDRTVAYLKQLPPDLIDLILEFVRWPLSEKPEVGMEVFLADSDNAERLPRERVLALLHEVDEKLEMQYLEHIMDEYKETHATRHQRLIDIYISLLQHDEDNDEQRSVMQTKLETFLRKSTVYDKPKTLKQLPTDNPHFYVSRALVLSAMSNHTAALSIYVFQLQDFPEAESYCNRLYAAQQADHQTCLLDPTNTTTTHPSPIHTLEPTSPSPTTSNIFATLLSLYLTPPPPHPKNWPQALDLLSRHGARLPTTSTLPLIPDDLPVDDLSDYFRGRLRTSTSLLRQDRITRGLEAVRRARVERELALGSDADALVHGVPAGRNRRVGVRVEDHCRVCHKRFAASAVRVMPDGTVLHYGCVGRLDGGKESGRGSWRGGRSSSASTSVAAGSWG